MNKNMVYIAVLAVMCVLAGAVVGASIARNVSFPWPCRGGQDFAEKAEFFMRHGPAQPGEHYFMKHGPHKSGEKGSGGDILEMFVTKLDLNKEQEAKVKEILDKTRQEIDEVGKNIRSAISEIKDKSDKKIMDILAPEQQQKFKDMLEDFKEKHGGGKRREKCGPMKWDRPRPEDEFMPHNNE